MRRNRFGPALMVQLGAALALLVVLLPVFYAIILSTQSPADYYAFPPRLHIGDRALENYTAAWEQAKLGRLLFNTTVVAVSVSLGKIVLSLLAAFAFVYFEFRGKIIFFVLILITHMLPLEVRIVPTFQLIERLDWVNTFYALTIPFFASATGMLLFHQFFRTVSAELVDAARMDGATPMQFLRHVLIPLSIPNMTALFLIEFIYMWNQYLWPLIVANFEKTRQIQIGLQLLIATETTVDWHIVMAGVVIMLLPPLILLLALQRQFLAGIAMQQQQ